MMGYLSRLWANVSDGDKASWKVIADQIVASEFNAFVKTNMNRWSDFNFPINQAAGVGGNTAATLTSLAVVGGARTYTATVTFASLDDTVGFGIARGTGAAFSLSRLSFDDIMVTEAGTLVYTFQEKNVVPGNYFIRVVSLCPDGSATDETGDEEPVTVT